MATSLERREARGETLDVRVTLVTLGLSGVRLFGWMLVRVSLQLLEPSSESLGERAEGALHGPAGPRLGLC